MSYKPYRTIKSTGFEFEYINGSGVTVDKGVPVKIKTDGNIDFINVSLEADVLALGGVTSTQAANGVKASVVTAGRIENITTTAVFGDALYLSKTGFLTNVKPSTGIDGFIAGDFCVRIGTVGKNESNPLQKDLILELQLVGQLG